MIKLLGDLILPLILISLGVLLKRHYPEYKRYREIMVIACCARKSEYYINNY